jgi:putative heme-binding domain-containing protein
LICVVLGAGAVAADDRAAMVGPATEARFPPLNVPKGFSATLFACDPLVEYPSAIALGPRPGTLFVASDYVKGLGVWIVRPDDIRVVEDTNGDGYADRAPVFAAGFGSIQGMEYFDDVLYVMHAPLLTALRDRDGDGVADERRDLVSGLGLPPEKNPSRLHCANGVVIGHDGWLYLALGDNGCNVARPEGDRLVLEGGGILRARPDGSDLHVFATGLRNIYDVAMDEELNVFVRDNENDGGDYMVRVYWSFFGADHGYPYLYRDRPDEALGPIADLGRGSSAGGVCYRERAFPPEFHGNLFFCEWGRAVVRYTPERSGSGFAVAPEQEFALGDAEDPYGFKPTDIVVQPDGSLMVSDWADDQSTARGRARIYHIRYAGKPNEAPRAARRQEPRLGSLEGAVALLDSESYHLRFQAQRRMEKSGDEALKLVRKRLAMNRLGVRGRRHAVWIAARLAGPQSLDELFALLEQDPDASVRLEAVRAIADLSDPVFVQHKLDAGRGDVQIANRLAAAWPAQPPSVRLEIVVALGRLEWADAPAWLASALERYDAPLAHASMLSMRRSKNWTGVLALVDRPSSDPIRRIALGALAEQYDAAMVDGLVQRLDAESDSQRRREYVDLLSRVWKKPGPWVYWGYRPAPRPATTVSWTRSSAIESALDRALARLDGSDLAFALGRMQHEKIPTRLATLRRCLSRERAPEAVSAILSALGDQHSVEVEGELAQIVADERYSAEVRKRALSILVKDLDEAREAVLIDLAKSVPDGPVLAAIMLELGRRPTLESRSVLLEKLRSGVAQVRSACIDALAKLAAADSGGEIVGYLDDPDPRVRLAAAKAVGALRAGDAAGALARLASQSDPVLREASFRSLRLLRDPCALELALEALDDQSVHLSALEYVAELGGPEHAEAVAQLARRSPSHQVLATGIRALAHWQDAVGVAPGRKEQIRHLMRELQGTHSRLLHWLVRGPLAADELDGLQAMAMTGDAELEGESAGWRHAFSDDASQVVLRTADNGQRTPRAEGDPAQSSYLGPLVWLATSTLYAADRHTVRFDVASRNPLQLWLNGKRVYEQTASGASESADSFEAELPKGASRVLVRLVADRDGAARYEVRLRRALATAELERLTLLALKQTGDAENGRKLFFDADKTKCIKCHRLADRGEAIGPDLTGFGSRFSRIYIIESILQPSQSVAPSYRSLALTRTDGRVFSGLLLPDESDDKETLTIADNQGQKHVIRRAEIAEQTFQSTSTMPEGLEKQITPAEFVDLVAFLASQKESP